jgi:phospholipase/carboxylesterase
MTTCRPAELSGIPGGIPRLPSVDRSAASPSLPVGPEMSRRHFLWISLSALAAPTLLGCDSSTGPESRSPRLAAQPGSPTETPTQGLSQLGLGGSRDGLLYVPDSYSPDTAAPLFVGLHGAGGAGDTWASYYARAEARGMILLAPDSRSATWELIRDGGFGPDVEFLDRALEHTFERCRIDPERIALGGFSDGASYALSLGLSNGDLFSHLVAYSPGFMQATNPIVGKPRIFVSHGQLDPILPVTTSRDFIVPSLRDDGYDVTYHEFSGGHEVPASISELALDWFLG